MGVVPQLKTVKKPPAAVGQRLVYQLLRASSRVARRYAISLKDFQSWLQMAYFHDLRSRGLSLQEVADALQISISKAALLSKQLKTNFMRDEENLPLPRRIEFLVWAEALSQAKIEQALGDSSADEVNKALRKLIQEGRLEEQTRGRRTVYARTRKDSRLVSERIESRLDGMSALATNVASAFAFGFEDGRHDVFTRTVNFHANKRDLADLAQLYETHVWPKIVELEARAEEGEAQSFDLSFLWAPSEEKKTQGE